MADRDFTVLRVSASDASITVTGDDDPLLTTAKVAARLGIAPASWRSLVRDGRTPKPDDPGDLDSPANRRMPRWRASTIDRYERERPSASWKRKGRASE